MTTDKTVYFVTGATGFLGRRVIAALQDRDPDARIRCLIRQSALAPRGVNLEPIVGDLHDDAALRRGVAGCRVVLHLAAVTHSSAATLYTRVNVEGTARLVQACRWAKVRRVVFASSRAIGERCGSYARSKREAEELLRNSGLPYVILRFAEIYGPGATDGIGALVRLVRTLPVVPILRGVVLTPVALDDAVQSVLASLMAEQAEGKSYTIAGPRSYRFEECVRLIAAGLRRRRLCLPVPVGLLRLSLVGVRCFGWRGLVADQVERLLCEKDANIQPAVQDLGFRPRSFSEGMRTVCPQHE